MHDHWVLLCLYHSLCVRACSFVTTWLSDMHNRSKLPSMDSSRILKITVIWDAAQNRKIVFIKQEHDYRVHVPVWMHAKKKKIIITLQGFMLLLLLLYSYLCMFQSLLFHYIDTVREISSFLNRQDSMFATYCYSLLFNFPNQMLAPNKEFLFFPI